MCLCVKLTSVCSFLQARRFFLVVCVLTVPFHRELKAHSFSGGQPRGSRGAFRWYDEVAV